MPYRRRRVFVETSRGRRSVDFTVPQEEDAADVSMELRRRGFAPYRLTIDAEQNAWIAVVMDWQRAAWSRFLTPPARAPTPNRTELTWLKEP